MKTGAIRFSIAKDDMGKWIEFERYPPKEGMKTSLWIVKTKEDSVSLGLIKWFSRWRTYAFFPANGTVYEDDCLRDIAEFIEARMLERKIEK